MYRYFYELHAYASCIHTYLDPLLHRLLPARRRHRVAAIPRVMVVVMVLLLRTRGARSGRVGGHRVRVVIGGGAAAPVDQHNRRIKGYERNERGCGCTITHITPLVTQTHVARHSRNLSRISAVSIKLRPSSRASTRSRRRTAEASSPCTPGRMGGGLGEDGVRRKWHLINEHHTHATH